MKNTDKTDTIKTTPPWAKFRSEMHKSFPSPYRGNFDSLAKSIYETISELDKLKPEKSGSAAFLGTNPELVIDFENVKKSSLHPKMSTANHVIKQVINMFEGLPNWGHPLTMCNVMPQGNTVATVAAILTEVLATNILEGEYAWNIHQAELESAGILGNLAGWQSEKAGCVYTYGGSGCWTYHLKYALSRVLPNSRNTGIRTDAKVICSQQAHYTMLNSSDWLGLGMNNIIRIKTDIESNAMDTIHLEEVLQDCQAKGIPVASVVCTMGTTDANAFDPVEEVRRLLDKYPNPPEYGKALLYCDSVIGWSWLAFKNYDFTKNPLGFSQDVLPYIEKNYNAIKEVFYADAFGVDFHKTGFAPYISSVFVYKNAEEFESLLSRETPAYLQSRSPYNPMNYTLEVSRAATGSVAGWATLKFFGHEGFQSVLGGILENKVYLQNQITKNSEMVCVTPSDYGLVTLLRIYEKGVDAQVQYKNELKNPDFRDDLIKHNQLILTIGDTLFKWFRSGKKIDGQCTPYLSFSTGFRTTEYNRDMSDKEAVILFLLLIFIIIFIFSQIIIFYKDLKTKDIYTNKLKKSQELFFNLFNHNPASISMSRLSDHTIVNVNDSFLKLYGFDKKEEVIGKTGVELDIVIEQENSTDVYQQIHDNSTIKDIESHIHTKYGEIKWTSASVISMEINDEPCLLSVSVDVTNRKKAEEQLITLNKELEAFTYSVSHDLRAPLRAINGYAKILQEDYAETLDNEGKTTLLAIMKNSKKMGELIDDLLAFSRLGRKVISTTEINMNGLVNAVREDVILGITSPVEFSIADLFPAKGQQELIKQVWINLLSNALKFSKHQAIIKIEIGSEYKDNLVVYHVKDNGAGFDMKYYDKLFGVFQRLHSQEEFEGTGIGLAIVQKIVQRHNGKVWAESTLNEGTCFYFSLPTINS